MSVRRLTAYLLVVLVPAGCSQSNSGSNDAALPWQKALAKGDQGKQALPPPGQRQGAPAGSLEALLGQAQQLAMQGNLSGALDAAESALKKDADSRQAQFMIAAIAQSRAMELLKANDRAQADKLFLRSAQLAREIKKVAGEGIQSPELSLLRVAVYNEACCYALDGKADKAIASLKEAFLEDGAENYEQLDTDTDLVSLRGLPAFAELKSKAMVKRDEARKAALASAQEDARKSLADNKPFDFDFSLPDLAGAPIALGDFAGKVRIIDVWGTWCPPCRIEVPHFVALQSKYGDQGLQVIGVNYEQERLSPDDAKKAIKDFGESVGLNYPCVIGDRATRDKIPECDAFPTTLFIDRAGKVRAKTVGYKPLETIEMIVTTLLDEKQK
jgi:thiol-disulfide isomerase/thioredoxin